MSAATEEGTEWQGEDHEGETGPHGTRLSLRAGAGKSPENEKAVLSFEDEWF